jgi:antitoxin CcdA
MLAQPPVQERTAPRKAVNLSLSDDIVKRARSLTPNLSRTVEALLTDFVQREEANRRSEDEKLEAVIDAWNAFHAEHGSLSDEFSTL